MLMPKKKKVGIWISDLNAKRLRQMQDKGVRIGVTVDAALSMFFAATPEIQRSIIMQGAGDVFDDMIARAAAPDAERAAAVVAQTQSALLTPNKKRA